LRSALDHLVWQLVILGTARIGIITACRTEA
jgi:hypothetical protein